MSTRPRTPEHFPRMRDRAAGRRLGYRGHAARRARLIVDVMPTWTEFAYSVGHAAVGAVNTLMAAIDRVVTSWFPPVRVDFALTGVPAPTWGDWLTELVTNRTATGLEPGTWQRFTTDEFIARRRDLILPVVVNDFPRDRLRWDPLTACVEVCIDPGPAEITP